jgi:hypothetical protein
VRGEAAARGEDERDGDRELTASPCPRLSQGFAMAPPQPEANKEPPHFASAQLTDAAEN